MRQSLERITQLLGKELRQVRRDPRLLRIVLLGPMVQLILFGYAVSTDVRHTETIVVDQDHSAASRELVSRLEASGYFAVLARADDPRAVVNALEHGTAVVGITIPPRFAADLAAGRRAEVQVLLDGTNSNLASVARGYAERIVMRFGTDLAGSRLSPPIELAERVWYNPDLASRNYNVPAVAGAILMLICLLLTSLAVVREREIGTLEQLLVSPLRPWELIAGKTLPFALIGMLDLGLITTVALLWFRVPFRGSFLLLLVAGLLYLLSTLGLGLLISTLSSTQQEAFMGSFLVLMPALLLSGFLFPLRSMPTFFRWLTLLNPMRHFLEAVRAIFLKGAGLGALWPQLGALLLLGIPIFGLAILRFRQQARSA